MKLSLNAKFSGLELGRARSVNSGARARRSKTSSESSSSDRHRVHYGHRIAKCYLRRRHPLRQLSSRLRRQRRRHFAIALLSFFCVGLAFPAAATAHQAHLAQRPASNATDVGMNRLVVPWTEQRKGLELNLAGRPADALLALAATTSPAQHPALPQAQALNAEASERFSHGDVETALLKWQAAQAKYAEAGDIRGILGSQINQAQALQTLGLYRRARILMEDLQGQLQQQSDPEIQALGLQSLGSIFQATGYLAESRAVLEQSLAIAQEHQLDSSAIHITLGNTLRALREPEAALAQYRIAGQLSRDRLLSTEAQLNQLSLQVSRGQWKDARTLLEPIRQQLQTLPTSRRAVYSRVNFASSLMQLLAQQGPASAPNLANKTSIKAALPQLGRRIAAKTAALETPRGIAEQLTLAVKQSQELQDSRAESYALGELGTLYEQTGQLDDAAKLTRQALHIAQTDHAPDIAYRWQWQLGRIKTRQSGADLVSDGSTPLGSASRPAAPGAAIHSDAIVAYREAVTTLRSIRSDLVATNPEIQFSFRESVEPVYREFMSLLIQPDADEAMLTEARDAIEELQLAELENFFRSACLDVTSQKLDEIDRSAAVLYPIVLSDRLEVLMSLPGQPMSHHTVAVTPQEINRTIEAWLQSLTPIASSRRQLELAGQLYDWLIRPLAEQLQAREIQTLVFVPDSPLRNLPVAALHDGQQYLIENYQIALTPGLQLLEPKVLGQDQLQALSVGLTQPRQGFSALPGVQQEIEQIQATVPSQTILDDKFTKANLKQQLKSSSFPIIHLATHGQFSSDPEQTFLLTWDDKISVRDIRNLLKSRRNSREQSIELLVLSACQTAAGDNQAALGLAGLAVQSGARSTLATLWSVNDRSTAQFMTALYQDLASSEQISRASSLRQAQLALLKSDKYNHPFYWSSFVLVGNWL